MHHYIEKHGANTNKCDGGASESFQIRSLFPGALSLLVASYTPSQDIDNYQTVLGDHNVFSLDVGQFLNM